MTLSEFKTTLNTWGQLKVPFLFIIDFELEKPAAWTIADVNSNEILFNIDGFTNAKGKIKPTNAISLTRHAITFDDYRPKFEKVKFHLNYGDTFLTNLTIKTQVEISSTLHNLYFNCKSKYRLWYEDQFLVFTPETFVKIINGKIYSYPMKGTIDANISRAQEIILNDSKEIAEHITIVDLIRNDLSNVASNVKVNRFRYIEEVKTNHKNLLQVSSEIEGDLPSDYNSRIGDILVSLMPAGSVSGAPKPKTLEVIREAEREKRGYYTGIFGYFDGKNLDSAVMIRFIEQNGTKLYYRSGGGITAQSHAETEFAEALDKIYVPID
jgi:para-aminobenzoate synthetase component 1